MIGRARDVGPRWRRLLRLKVRRSVAWLERRAPLWFDDVPGQLASVQLHLVLVLLLAILVFQPKDSRGRIGPELALGKGPSVDEGKDFTELDDLDPIGEPITVPVMGEVEALRLPTIVPADPSAPKTDAPAPPIVSKPKEGQGPPPPAAGPPATTVMAGPADQAPFSGRRGEGKAKLLAGGGGNAQSEAAVELALEWFKRHQELDGSWRLDYHARCDPKFPCPSDKTQLSDTAATGLALLALLGAGHVPNEDGPYRETVQKGLDWLIEHEEKEGALVFNTSANNVMYSHAIATIALCEAYGLTRDDRLAVGAQRAVRFIVRAQNEQDGGWRYAPKQRGDTSVFGWQLMALRSAKLAGLEVSGPCIQKAAGYLDRAAATPDGALYGYKPRYPANPVMTAEALLCRQYLGWRYDSPALITGVKSVVADLSSVPERNIYYWYYATQLLHNVGGPDWEAWNVRVRDALVSTQVLSDDCDRGSWDPVLPEPDRWASSAGGRLYLTALSTLTLEVYYRYLPLARTPDAEFDRPDGQGGAERVAKPRAGIGNIGNARKGAAVAPSMPQRNRP